MNIANPKITRIHALFVAALCGALAAPAARAISVEYTFTTDATVTFGTEGTAAFAGGFMFDAVTADMSNINITVTGGSIWSGTYTDYFPAWTSTDGAGVTGFTYLGIMQGPSCNDGTCEMFRLTFQGILDGQPGTHNLRSPTEGYNGGEFNDMQQSGTAWTGGVQAAVVPVPAAAWLFGSGLLGLVGMARRKKAA